MPNLSAPQGGSADGPYPVREKRPHRRAHNDELLGNEIGNKCGDTKLPGFRTAPIKEIDSGLHLDEGKDGWHFLIREQIACLGACGGPFDEHSDYNGHQDEFVLTNCALKMARSLHVADDPALVPILAYSLKSDRTSKRGPWDIDPIIKEWWRMGLSTDEVYSMYHAIFEGWYHVFSGRAPLAEPRGTFRQAIARWMLKKFRGQDPHLERLLAELRTGLQVVDRCKLARSDRGINQMIALDTRDMPNSKEPKKTAFDLEGIWECLWAAGIAAEVIERIIEVSFEAKYREQTQFVLAEQEFITKAKYLPSDQRYPYSVALIYSESEYVNRAARHIDPNLDVLLVFLRSGHLRIFDMHKRLNLDPIAARLREAELLNIKGRHGLSWKYLESKGTIREVPAWYNSHDNLGVFNSTETSPGTRTTLLKTPCLLAAIKDGLAHLWEQHHIASMAKRNELIRKAKERKREARRTKEAAASSQP